MPKREDEFYRRGRDDLRYCPHCKRWYTLKQWETHTHNPKNSWKSTADAEERGVIRWAGNKFVSTREVKDEFLEHHERIDPWLDSRIRKQKQRKRLKIACLVTLLIGLYALISFLVWYFLN